MISKIELQILSLACLARVASGSTTASPPSNGLSASASSTLMSNELEELPEDVLVQPTLSEAEQDFDDGDSFKANEDWWRDPFAMFEDDDEDQQQAREVAAEDSASEVLAPSEKTPSEDIPEGELVIMSDLDISKAPVKGKQQEKRSSKGKRLATMSSSGGKRLAAMSSSGGKRLANTVTAPLALLLPVVPKVRAALKAIPFVQALTVAALLKAMYEPMKKALDEVRTGTSGKIDSDSSKDKKRFHPEQIVEEEEESESETEEQDANEQDEVDARIREEEDRRKQRQPSITKRTTAPPASIPRRSRPSRKHDIVVTDDFKEPSRGFGGIFSGRRRQGEKLPPAKELMNQVRELQQIAEASTADKELMEREYEKSSWQLQEARSEVSSLTSTTRYLKSQLRDNEEVLDRAIKAERRRAKSELSRMKEAMLNVLERERRAMRDTLRKQTAEVQSMLKSESFADNDGSDSVDNVDNE